MTKPLLIFLFIALVSLLINLKQGIASGLPLSFFYLTRLIIYPSLFFAGKYLGFERIRKPLYISLGIFSLLCLIQYIAFPDMRFLKYLGFDDHYFRLIGPFYDPNFTGAIFAGISLYLICKQKYLYSVPFIAMLAITFSRASYLAFAICLIYILLSQRKFKLFLLLILLGTVVYLLPKPSGEGVNLLRTFSIFSRIESWQTGMTLFINRPLFGWGYNTLRGVANSRFQIDNSFIYILATTGTFGFIAFVSLLYKLIKKTKDPGIKIIISSLIIHALFNNTIFYIWIFAFMLIILGIGQDKTKEYKQA